MSGSARPPVAVVLPFHGDGAGADAALAQLAGLRTGPGDEVVLADNTPGAVAETRERPEGVRVLACEVKSSAYAARNIGAEATQAPWLLFVDADCELPADLLDAYFDPAPADGEGALAGPVVGDPDQPGLIPSYVRSRGHLDQEWQLQHPYRPLAVTANLLVRRSAWESVGGFAEGTRSGADADFCWRLQDAGWTLGFRERAGVRHRHRESLRALLAQARRDGSAAPWLARRHPGYPPRTPWSAFPRAIAGAFGWPLLGQPRRGLFKAVDGIWAAAFNLGSIADDAGPLPRLARPPERILLVQEFPAAGDPLVAALAEPGGPVTHVEALRRPARGDWRRGRHVAMRHWEDDNALTRARAAGLRRERRQGGLAAPARRFAQAAPGAVVLAEPGLEATAGRIAQLAGRPDLVVESLPADRTTLARHDG